MQLLKQMKEKYKLYQTLGYKKPVEIVCICYSHQQYEIFR